MRANPDDVDRPIGGGRSPTLQRPRASHGDKPRRTSVTPHGCDTLAVGLDHVQITVADRELSARFYAEHFGLEERVHEDHQLLIVADAGMQSLLALRVGSSGATQAVHFGFRLDTPSAVRAQRRRFAEAGVQELEWEERGPTRCQVADPDGYRVEVYAF